jgi:hypothetical protein
MADCSLLTRTTHLLTAPVFADEDKTRVARLLNIIMLTSVGAAILSGLVSLLIAPVQGPRLVLLSLMIVGTVGTLFLMHCGWIRLAAGLLSSTLLVIITLVVLASGGVRSPGVGVYPSVIVMTSLLLGGRAGLVFAGLSIVIGLGLLHAEIHGVLPPPFISLTAASAWVAQSGQAVVVAGLLFCTVRSVDSAQARVRDTTHAQVERTRALQESRVLLETRARQQRAIAELGRRALASRDLTTPPCKSQYLI